MPDTQIRGAISVGTRTFVAGDEKELAEAIKKNNEAVKVHNERVARGGSGKVAEPIDLDVLIERGALGDAAPAGTTISVNKQRDQDGERIEGEGENFYPARSIAAGGRTETRPERIAIARQDASEGKRAKAKRSR